MISQLTGTLVHVSAEEVILDVNGVGYQLFVSKGNLGTLMGMQGQRATLFTETHVREDHIHLYAFLTAEDRAWFKKLNAVTGVGAKTAQAILSACPPSRLVGAIAAGDHKAISAAEGVGPKLAQRLIVELKDKLPTTGIQPVIVPMTTAKGKAAAVAAPAPSVVDDVVSALVHLGYDRTLAHQTASRIAYANDNAMTLDALLKAALQELSA